MMIVSTRPANCRKTIMKTVPSTSAILAACILLATVGLACNPEASDHHALPADASELDGLNGQAVLQALGEDFQPVILTMPEGLIDWTRGVVIATGTATGQGSEAQAHASALSGARQVAARNAILLLVRLNVGYHGATAPLQTGRLSVDAILTDFEEASRDYDPQTRQATVRLQAPMWGASGVVRSEQMDRTDNRPAWPWPKPTGDDGAEPIDGIVIHVFGIVVPPVLLPSVITENDQRVFGLADLPDGQMGRQPMLIYVQSRRPRTPEPSPTLLTRARTVFRRPLVLEAHSLSASRAALVLSESAERQLLKHPEARECFRSGRVIIVIDSPD